VLVSITLVLYFAFGTNKNYDYFDTEFDKYNEVVSLVRDNKLESVDFKDESGLLGKRLYLPKEYKKLSRNGTVIYDTKNGILTLLFVTNWDIMGEHPGGYLYRSNNLPPARDDFQECVGITEKSAKDFWFKN
jgi:hypothetical protein